MFKIEFYDKNVVDDFEKLPEKLQSKMLHLLELLSVSGSAIDRKFTDSFGDGLFELRAKALKGSLELFTHIKMVNHNHTAYFYQKRSKNTKK